MKRNSSRPEIEKVDTWPGFNLDLDFDSTSHFEYLEDFILNYCIPI